jgi:hypothetical protein
MASGPDATAPIPGSGASRPRRRTRLWLAVGVVVLVLLILAGIVGSLPSPGGSPASTGRVDVGAVHWSFNGTDRCVNASTTSGAIVKEGADFTVSLPLNSSENQTSATNCTVSSESIRTPGFSIVQSNTPLVISPGADEFLTVEIAAPDQNVTTDISLEGSVATGNATNATTKVDVTGVKWQFSGTVPCFNDTSTAGTVVAGNDVFTVDVKVKFSPKDSNETGCSVESVATTTSGFTYVESDTPLLVPAGKSGQLSVEVRAPDQNVTGTLTLNASTVVSVSVTSSVNVTAVNWDFSGPSNCWGDMTGNGTVVTGGDQFTVTIKLSYTAGLLDPNSCTVQSESVGTSGFTYVSANTPLVVDSGSTQTLAVTVRAPVTNETVVLTLDGTVTSP